MSTSALKVYVTGKWADHDFLSEVIETLETNYNIQITYNWTVGRGDHTRDELCQLNVSGVKECDLLLVVITDEHYEYRGTFTEIGVALGANKKIIMVNPFKHSYCSEHFFYNHPQINHVNSFDNLHNELEKLMDDRTQTTHNMTHLTHDTSTIHTEYLWNLLFEFNR